MQAVLQTKIDEPLLEDMLTNLEKAKTWGPRAVSRLENLVRTGEDVSLFRVNPLKYASERGVPEQEAVEIFLYAASVGLFDMEWNLLCPGCTSVVESFASLNNLDSHFHCHICNADNEASLDDYIQISFTVSPLVREIAFHHPELLSDADYLMKYHFSREGRVNGDANWLETMVPHVPFFSYLEPGERKTFSGKIHDGFLVASDLINHTGTALVVGGVESGPATGAIIIKPGLVRTDVAGLASGSVTLTFQNDSPRRSLAALINLPADYKTAYPVSFAPFLSGKRLLNTQAFHDLFRHEVIKSVEGLGIKDVTILFTDLKGSTALYERIGDLKAFSLVRQHFDVLGRVINEHGGAIVKTIGDAVMGSFMSSSEAVKAALEMRRAIQDLEQKTGRRDLIIKIGIHRGASIVVTLNDRLDYFGQTVNVASRVQNLANADEIYLSEEVYNQEGVRSALGDIPVREDKAKLKGIMDEVRVYVA